MTRGARLRLRREALGWSLTEVAQRTRIPIAHLEAIEGDRTAELPAGPWAARYVETLEELYGLPPEVAPAPVELTHPVRRAGLPLQAVRLLAAVSVAALLGAIGFQVWRQPSLVPGLEAALTPTLPAPDQRVVVTTRRTVRLTVHVDGELVHDRQTSGGETLTFAGRDEVRIGVPATDAVRLRWNDERIVPLGRRTTPRVIRFVDDDESGA